MIKKDRGDQLTDADEVIAPEAKLLKHYFGKPIIKLEEGWVPATRHDYYLFRNQMGSFFLFHGTSPYIIDALALRMCMSTAQVDMYYQPFRVVQGIRVEFKAGALTRRPGSKRIIVTFYYDATDGIWCATTAAPAGGMIFMDLGPALSHSHTTVLIREPDLTHKYYSLMRLLWNVKDRDWRFWDAQRRDLPVPGRRFTVEYDDSTETGSTTATQYLVDSADASQQDIIGTNATVDNEETGTEDEGFYLPEEDNPDYPNGQPDISTQETIKVAALLTKLEQLEERLRVRAEKHELKGYTRPPPLSTSTAVQRVGGSIKPIFRHAVNNDFKHQYLWPIRGTCTRDFPKPLGVTISPVDYVWGWKANRTWLLENPNEDVYIKDTILGTLFSNWRFLAVSKQQQAIHSDIKLPVLMALWTNVYIAINSEGEDQDARLILTVVFKRTVDIPVWLSRVQLDNVEFTGATVHPFHVGITAKIHPAVIQEFPFRLFFALFIEQAAPAYESLEESDSLPEGPPEILNRLWGDA
jgi:hypothetical protein